MFSPSKPKGRDKEPSAVPSQQERRHSDSGREAVDIAADEEQRGRQSKRKEALPAECDHPGNRHQVVFEVLAEYDAMHHRWRDQKASGKRGDYDRREVDALFEPGRTVETTAERDHEKKCEEDLRSTERYPKLSQQVAKIAVSSFRFGFSRSNRTIPRAIFRSSEHCRVLPTPDSLPTLRRTNAGSRAVLTEFARPVD